MTEGFCWNYQSKDERWTSWSETEEILSEIHAEIESNPNLIYVHEVC